MNAIFNKLAGLGFKVKSNRKYDKASKSRVQLEKLADELGCEIFDASVNPNRFHSYKIYYKGTDRVPECLSSIDDYDNLAGVQRGLNEVKAEQK